MGDCPNLTAALVGLSLLYEYFVGSTAAPEHYIDCTAVAVSADVVAVRYTNLG